MIKAVETVAYVVSPVLIKLNTMEVMMMYLLLMEQRSSLSLQM
jgi:hypothetical protein